MPKIFAVVMFPEEGDTIAVVPTSWLDPDSGHCLWPPGETLQLVKAQVPPGTTEEGWKPHPAKVVARSRKWLLQKWPAFGQLMW